MCPSSGESVSGSGVLPRAHGPMIPLVARAAAEAIDDDRRVATGARIIEMTAAAMAA